MLLMLIATSRVTRNTSQIYILLYMCNLLANVIYVYDPASSLIYHCSNIHNTTPMYLRMIICIFRWENNFQLLTNFSLIYLSINEFKIYSYPNISMTPKSQNNLMYLHMFMRTLFDWIDNWYGFVLNQSNCWL